MSTDQNTSADTGTKQYAAFDKTYLRFVSGVHDTRTAAGKAAKAAGADNVEIREV